MFYITVIKQITLKFMHCAKICVTLKMRRRNIYHRYRLLKKIRKVYTINDMNIIKAKWLYKTSQSSEFRKPRLNAVWLGKMSAASGLVTYGVIATAHMASLGLGYCFTPKRGATHMQANTRTFQHTQGDSTKIRVTFT